MDALKEFSAQVVDLRAERHGFVPFAEFDRTVRPAQGVRVHVAFEVALGDKVGRSTPGGPTGVSPTMDKVFVRPFEIFFKHRNVAQHVVSEQVSGSSSFGRQLFRFGEPALHHQVHRKLHHAFNVSEFGAFAVPRMFAAKQDVTVFSSVHFRDGNFGFVLRDVEQIPFEHVRLFNVENRKLFARKWAVRNRRFEKLGQRRDVVKPSEKFVRVKHRSHGDGIDRKLFVCRQFFRIGHGVTFGI